MIQALILLPYPGLQTDEALFASVLYEPRNLELALPAFHHRIPLMIISYLGSLKSALYALWFALWPPSTVSVRLPVILLGAWTVWLLFRLLEETVNRRAAWIGALLLATDATFLLTTTFDWGPVALQHWLLLAGLLLLVRFSRTVRAGALAGAFFCFGLGLWDKAIFFWMLSGVALAAVLLLHREIRALISVRRLLIAAGALLVGAAPLLIYNLRYRGPTFRHAQYSAAELGSKARLLQAALNGSSLFGYLTREPDGFLRRDPPSALERAVMVLSDAARQPRTNLLVPALLASLASLIWLRSPVARRAILFAVVAVAVAWLEMALNRDTGGSTHHVVLLWPWPQWMVAAAFSQPLARRRRWLGSILAGAILVVAGANLLVTNEYLAQWIRHGPGSVWSDAIEPLAATLERTPAESVIVTDWGILDSLRLLGRGRWKLYQAIDLASKDALDPAEQRSWQWLLTLPDPVFVGHVPAEESVAGSTRRIAQLAAQSGHGKRLLATVSDRHGRPIFELYRLEPISVPAPR